MNPTLMKTLIALAPMSAIVIGSLVLVARRRSTARVLQAIGATCLLVVILAHLCESLHLLPWMHWGVERSAGHYLDLASAVLGITLFPLGYLTQAIYERSAHQCSPTLHPVKTAPDSSKATES